MLSIEAAAWREEQEMRRAVTTAWYTESFARTKRLDSLGSILSILIPEREKPMTKAQAMALLDDSKVEARLWAKRHNEQVARLGG